MIELYVALVALLIAVAMPISVLAIRESVKAGRLGIIHELERILQFERQPGLGERIVPSLEFVKYKYDSQGEATSLTDFSRQSYLIAAVPFVVLTFFFGCIALSFVAAAVVEPSLQSLRVIPQVGQFSGSDSTLVPGWVFTITYFGALMFVMRRLLRSVANFDLSPTTFLFASAHILLGIITAIIITSAFQEFFPAQLDGVGGKIAFSVLIVAAFVVGFVPDAGLRMIILRSRLQLLKKEDDSVYKSVKTVSIDVLEGIDSDVRDRLGQHNIVDVQNMATVNPLLLYVETPYGFYELIDWVGQAQLCTAVGIRKYLAFRELNIRTMFDLERVVLDEAVSSPEMRQAVGEVLFSEQLATNDDAAPPPDAAEMAEEDAEQALRPVVPSDELVIGTVEAMVDDLHVQRLRQIWNRMELRLGTANRRLSPLPSRGAPPEAEAGAEQRRVVPIDEAAKRG